MAKSTPKVFNTIDELIDRYKGVKTGQDLKDAGVIPKTSPAHLALLLRRRIAMLQERSLASINDEMLGAWVPALVPDASGIYRLAPGVAADKDLGHAIRFADNIKGPGVHIKAGGYGRLLSYDPKTNMLSAGVEPESDKDKMVEHTFSIGSYSPPQMKMLSNALQVSTLGAIRPKGKHEAIREEVLAKVFPRTVIDPEITEKVLAALLMEKDVWFDGPPGSGKTNLAEDILLIMQQQGVLFHPEGCQSQCNPYSVFDPVFAKAVPPCPECTIKYSANGGDFRKTGRFIAPDPSKVPVVVARLTDGKGIEVLQCTSGLDRTALAGFKMPRGDHQHDAARESEFDPEGFHVGALSRTHNGALVLDEFEKMNPRTQDSFLGALQGNRVKPDQLRFLYPAHAVVIATSNDPTPIKKELNDRILRFRLDYPTDRDQSYEITRRSYHKEYAPLEELPVEDTSAMPSEPIRQVLLPMLVEKAVDGLYIRLREKLAQFPNADDIVGGNRSKEDALHAARAFLTLDEMLPEDDTPVPAIPNAQHALRGIEMALQTRLRIKSKTQERQVMDELVKFINEEYPKVLAEERETWWCRIHREMAIRDTQIPGISGRYRSEIDRYERDPAASVDAFTRVRDARAGGRGADKGARIDYPFMDRLFVEQPGFERAAPEEVEALIGYLMEIRKEVTSCKLE